MQGKVSMIVPCYNKESDIDAMLQSVYDQKWDHIELLLINDGSTDGTREKIAAWEGKLADRGYHVIIIDQENGGCCAAVYAGLQIMTGDYFCIADCDDALDPEYVSRMAGFLDDHSDYEWAACNFEERAYGETLVVTHPQYPYPQDTSNLLLRYIFRQVTPMVWIYMVRTSYVRKCKLTENFYAGRSRTYEPLVLVPLALGGGKLKYFNEPLYLYNMMESGVSFRKSLESVYNFFDDYYKMYAWAFDKAELSSGDREQYTKILHVARLKSTYEDMIRVCPEEEAAIQETLESMAKRIDEYFGVAVPTERLRHSFNEAMAMLANWFGVDAVHGRIIGYGANGVRGRKWIPVLQSAGIAFDALWDNANESCTTLFGKAVQRPDFASLRDGDVVVVFPSSSEILDFVVGQAAFVGANVIVLNSNLAKQISRTAACFGESKPERSPMQHLFAYYIWSQLPPLNGSLALCIPTHNRARVVEDMIRHNLPIWQAYEVDVYFYDSSTDDDTKQIVGKAMSENKFIYYVRLPSDMHSNQKVYRIFQKTGFQREYEYVWLNADYILWNELVYYRLMHNLEAKKDMYIIQYRDVLRLGDKQYADPFALFREQAWFLTWYGAAVLKADYFLTGNDWQAMESKYCVADRINFNHVAFYFEKLAGKDSVDVQHMVVPKRFFGVSIYRISPDWKSFVFPLWFEYWPGAINALPDCYGPYKQEVIHSHSVYGLSTTSVHLKLYREAKIFNFRTYLRYMGKWHMLANTSELYALAVATLPPALFRNHVQSAMHHMVKYLKERPHENVYLYGAGLYGSRYAAKLNEYEIPFKGFVVSDKKNAPAFVMNQPVFELQELLEAGERICLILSLKSDFANEVVPVLLEKGFRKASKKCGIYELEQEK